MKPWESDETKPWERSCPSCGGRGPDRSTRCDGPCQGTGVVPMTTAEMLEALAADDGPVMLFNDIKNEWVVSLGTRGAHHGRTPDGALRAALAAVAA